MTDTLELHAIDTQRRRFGAVALAAIVVSFVHMAAALTLFSGPMWHEKAAALAMTALVDWATWAIAEYLDYAKRRQLARSRWIKVVFAFALIISMALNAAYLVAHRPPEGVIPGWLSAVVAAAFAVFVPLLIAVASLARGELTDDRLTQTQAAQAETSARADLAQTRAALAQAEADAVQLRTQLAQTQAEAARATSDNARLCAEREMLDQDNARLESDAARLNAAHARIAAELAQTTAELTQARAELEQARAATALDPLALARQMIDAGLPSRKAAQIVGMSESTLRGRLKALTNGHAVAVSEN